MLVCSLLMKTKKSLAHGVSDAFATHACFVYGVANTSCWAWNGSTQCCVFTTLNLICYQTNWVKNCSVYPVLLHLSKFMHWAVKKQRQEKTPQKTPTRTWHTHRRRRREIKMKWGEWKWRQHMLFVFVLLPHFRSFLMLVPLSHPTGNWHLFTGTLMK